MFQLLPAVDVADGVAVRLVQGEAGTETAYGDPLAAALAWQEAGASWIHLVDLDRAFGTGSNATLLAEIVGRLDIDVDLDKVSLDDKKVYDMLARGETLGVFQMAGSGMTAYLKELQPTVVHDLNAMVALYRPGPMAFIPDYIARKKNPRLVTYLDPRLESILKPTYGILIYQDDVMMMAVQLAGYSWGEADKFRKAMGKKIPEEMAKQKDRFLTGTVERGDGKGELEIAGEADTLDVLAAIDR